MTIRPFFFVPVALIACGKPAALPVSAPTAAAPAAPSSHVSIAIAGSGIKADVAGPSFAQLDPSSSKLTVFAFRADTLPTPSCDTLSAFKLTSGGLVTLQVPNFSGPGKFGVLEGGFFQQDPKTEKLTMGAEALTATSIEVRSYDATAIRAEITTTAPDSASKASGTVVGTMCPPKEIAKAEAASFPQGAFPQGGFPQGAFPQGTSPLAGGGGSGGGASGGGASLGGSAPKLDGRSMIGKKLPVSIAALKGKVVVVVFWATWAAPCATQFAVLAALDDRYRSKGVAIVGVSEDDKPTGIAAFGKMHNVTFPLVWDEGKRIAGVWVPKSMPYTFIVDRSGRISFVQIGYHDGDVQTLDDEVRKVL